MSIENALALESSLISAISDELEQLSYLIGDKSGSTEQGDIHAQVSRLCGLTDLAHNELIPFAPATRLQMHELNEMAMGMIRNSLNFTPPSDDTVKEQDHAAALALFDAIALNIPYLVHPQTSNYAITISKEAFNLLQNHMGEHPEFEMMAALIQVQDYRVMKLAGDSREV